MSSARARSPGWGRVARGWRGPARACARRGRLLGLLGLLAVAGCGAGGHAGGDPLRAPDERARTGAVVNGLLAYSTAAEGATWEGLPIRQIRALDPAGGEELALTSAAASGCTAWCTSRAPAFSPDGRRIAFLSDRAGGYQEDDVYLMGADGAGQTRLTFGGDGDLHEDLAWSPDGRQLAFAARGVLPSPVEDGVFDVLVADAVDGRVRNLSSDPLHDDRSPAFSPDGARIAFVSTRDGSADVFVMDADGGAPVNLTRSAARDSHPAWSPDGSRIAFARWQDGVRGVLVVDAAGGEPRWLHRASGAEAGESWLEVAPAWSPDGGRILFAAGPWGRREVVVVRADGSGASDLAADPADDAVPVWSPDGRQVAFVSDRDGGYDVYLVAADGGPARRLSFGAGYALDLTWGRRPVAGAF